MNFCRPSFITPPVYSPAIGSMPLPSILVCTSARRRIVLTACSMNSGWPSSINQDGFLAGAEPHEFRIDQRIGDVEHIKRNAAVAVDIGEPEDFEPAHRVVVHAALHDDADIGGIAIEEFVQLVLLDEAQGRGPAALDLVLLVDISCRRQRDAVDVALGLGQRVHAPEFRPHIILGDEAAIDVAGADAQLQHHRRVGGLRKLEALLDRLDDRFARSDAGRAARPATSSQRHGCAPA